MPRPYRLPAERAAAKAEKETAAKRERFVQKIRMYIYTAGLDNAKVAKAMGVTRQTLYDRMKDPGMMRLNELERLSRVTGVPLVRFFEEDNASAI